MLLSFFYNNKHTPPILSITAAHHIKTAEEGVCSSSVPSTRSKAPSYQTIYSSVDILNTKRMTFDKSSFCFICSLRCESKQMKLRNYKLLGAYIRQKGGKSRPFEC